MKFLFVCMLLSGCASYYTPVELEMLSIKKQVDAELAGRTFRKVDKKGEGDTICVAHSKAYEALAKQKGLTVFRNNHYKIQCTHGCGPEQRPMYRSVYHQVAVVVGSDGEMYVLDNLEYGVDKYEDFKTYKTIGGK